MFDSNLNILAPFSLKLIEYAVTTTVALKVLTKSYKLYLFSVLDALCIQWNLTYPDTPVPRLTVQITEFLDK